jgi:eukaryotic-like serine/threonine-protein kinase
MAAWSVPGYAEARQLGKGASGRVVAAVHVATGRQVAIKYLAPGLLRDQGFVTRFRAEAGLLRSIAVPHVVRMLGYAEEPGHGAAIIMELVNGASLHAMISRNGPTEPEAALAVLKGSLLGLAAAHSLGIVHRDYKPENVLVDSYGTSKLSDFGVAVREGKNVPAAGTPLYMAPEQWLGAPASPASDIYAATAVFFECLTGKTPFPGPLGKLEQQHAYSTVPVYEVDEPLRYLIMRGMSKNPAYRPGHALAFLTELESTAAGAYGPDWEARGRELLRDAALALLLLLGQNTVGTGAGLARTGNWLAGSKATIAAGATALSLAAVGGGAVAAVALTGGSAPQHGTMASSSHQSASPTGQSSQSSPSPQPSVAGSATPSPTTTPSRTAAPTPSATPSSSGTGSGGTGSKNGTGGTGTGNGNGGGTGSGGTGNGNGGSGNGNGGTGGGSGGTGGGSGGTGGGTGGGSGGTGGGGTGGGGNGGGTGGSGGSPVITVAVSARSSPDSVSCDSPPPVFIVVGQITSNQATSVTYYWSGFDGTATTPVTITIPVGTTTIREPVKAASDTWSATETLQVTSPVSVSQATTLTVTCSYPPLSLSGSLPNGNQGIQYSASVTATGGDGNYTWSATGLPEGLSIDPASGVISGDPAVFGNFKPTITVTDHESPTPQTQRMTFPLTIIKAAVP